jgi:hypothetical protein
MPSFPKTLAAALGYVVAWLGTLVINLFRAPWILDCERQTAFDAVHAEIGNLKSALEREQYNLSDSLQLILGFNEEFFVRNIGNWVAQNARIHSMRVNNVLIYSDRINYVGAGDVVFNLRCRREGEDGSFVLKRKTPSVSGERGVFG